tara:strand:- start:16 stop:579 length:564 start_codon:yes stop_codon:yes gene_type:complete
MKSHLFILTFAVSILFIGCEKEKNEDLNRGPNWVLKPSFTPVTKNDVISFDVNNDGITDINWEREKIVMGPHHVLDFTIKGKMFYMSFSNQYNKNGYAYEKHLQGDPFDGSLKEHWCNHGWYKIFYDEDGTTSTSEVGVYNQKYIGFEFINDGASYFGWLEIKGQAITTIVLNKTKNQGVTFGDTGL